MNCKHLTTRGSNTWLLGGPFYSNVLLKWCPTLALNEGTIKGGKKKKGWGGGWEWTEEWAYSSLVIRPHKCLYGAGCVIGFLCQWDCECRLFLSSEPAGWQETGLHLCGSPSQTSRHLGHYTPPSHHHHPSSTPYLFIWGHRSRVSGLAVSEAVVIQGWWQLSDCSNLNPFYSPLVSLFTVQSLKYPVWILSLAGACFCVHVLQALCLVYVFCTLWVCVCVCEWERSRVCVT